MELPTGIGALGGPWGIVAEAGLGVLRNNAKRQDQYRQAGVNAEMMRNSPWTKLASQAAEAERVNQSGFNGGVDMAQNTSNALAALTEHGARNTEESETPLLDAGFKMPTIGDGFREDALAQQDFGNMLMTPGALARLKG